MAWLAAPSFDRRQVSYLTRYNGFSLQRPGIEELLPRLRQDALELQKLYGDQLKEQKLVK